VTETNTSNVGVVVIGRNEGERLKRCLSSLLGQWNGSLVYVDSGSTDGSVEYARSRGVQVHELDTTVPFTMARGRNAGFRALISAHPSLQFVQFVDGDCEVDGNWIATACGALASDPGISVVCGFRRERFPEASIYNRLTDMEWQGPVGDVDECGGDAMHRVAAFSAVGGFNEGMIAGEEPELCVRYRTEGGRIVRLDRPMTLHDAAIFEFAQWWKRNVRSGHAYAEGFALQGKGPFRHNRRRLISCVFYGLGVPSVWAGAFAVSVVPGLGLLRPVSTAVCVGLISRAAFGAYRTRRRMGNAPTDAALYAAFCTVGKVPEFQGALRYAMTRVAGKRSGLIEYKTS
jgi:glycosyltransferase involved in cell wall biosynthesis